MSKIMAIVCALFLFSTAASAQRFNAFVGYSHIGFGPNLYSLQLAPFLPHYVVARTAGTLRWKQKIFPSSGSWRISAVITATRQQPFPVASTSPPFARQATRTLVSTLSLLDHRSPCHSAGLSLMPMRFSVSLFPAHRSFYSTSFADLLGGGIDISLVPRLAWRAQADVTQTRFSVSEQDAENSLRLSTGLVLRF